MVFVLFDIGFHDKSKRIFDTAKYFIVMYSSFILNKLLMISIEVAKA
jgi:hypothetical protein